MKEKKSERVGLRISNDIHLSMEKERQEPSIIAESIALLLYLLGALITLHFTVETPLNVPLYGSAVLLAVGFPSLYHLKRWKRYIIPGLCLLYLLGLVLLRKPLYKGAQIFQKNLLDGMNQFFHTHFFARSVTGTEQDITLLVIMAAVLLAAFAGYAVSVAHSFVVVAAMELPFVWLAANLREKTLLSGILLMTLCFFMVYAMKCSDIHVHVRPANDDFAVGRRALLGRKGCRERIHYMDNPERMREGFLKNSLTVLALTLAAALAIGTLIPRDSYTWNELLIEFNQDPAAFFQEYSLKKLTERRSNQGIGGGVLGEPDRIEYKNEVQLRITGTDFRAPMYLKGYVGSVYDGSRWLDLEPSVYREERVLFSRFETQLLTPMTLSNGFHEKLENGILYPQDMETFREVLQEYDQAFEKGFSGNSIDQQYKSEPADLLYDSLVGYVAALPAPQRYTLDIQNVRADPRYLYTPYYLYSNPYNSSWNANAFVTDTIMQDPRVKQGDTYSLEAYHYPLENGVDYVSGSGLAMSNGLEIFYRSSGENAVQLQLRQDYADFAVKNYTRLPETGLERLRQDYPPRLLAEYGLPEVVRMVREALASECTYDLAPGRTPGDKDFAEYFLYENKRGYCMHFATTATLMFRSMGIPARYVEGYIVTDRDYTGERTAEIPDRNAHAWTEIYVEPFGWVPIETTPGFTAEAIAPPQYEVSSDGIEEGGSSETEVSSALPSSDGPLETSSEKEVESDASSDTLLSSLDAATSAVSSGDTIPAELPREKLPEALLRALLAVACILGVLLLVGGIAWLRRKLALQRRAQAFRMRDRSKAAIAVYQYILELLRFAGFSQANMGPQEYARHVAENWTAVLAGDIALTESEQGLAERFGEVTEAALEARFGGQTLSKERLEFMLEYAGDLDRFLYNRLKLQGKLRYQFVKNLR